jgi:hypothetical protein
VRPRPLLRPTRALLVAPSSLRLPRRPRKLSLKEVRLLSECPFSRLRLPRWPRLRLRHRHRCLSRTEPSSRPLRSFDLLPLRPPLPNDRLPLPPPLFLPRRRLPLLRLCLPLPPPPRSLLRPLPLRRLASRPSTRRVTDLSMGRRLITSWERMGTRSGLVGPTWSIAIW